MNDTTNGTEIRDKHEHKHDHEPKETVGAVFESREEARKALGALHKAHFTKSWFGVTSVATDSHGDETLTAESATANPFSLGSKGLVDALVAHGIEGDVARTIESEIEPGQAIVTVETGKHDPARAMEILERFGGRTELSGARRPLTASAAKTPPDRSNYQDYTGTEREDVVDGPMWEEETFFVRGRR